MSFWRALGPRLTPLPLWEALRIALGIGLGLSLAQIGIGLWLGQIWGDPWLIAPFGASAVLVYAVPTSPLAQPWSVVVGNGISGLVALGVLDWGVLALGLPILPAAILAASLAAAAMGLARATHPPGGAVALALVLAAAHGPAPDLGFWASRVVLGSVLLVGFALLWHPLTGRFYPLPR